MEQKIKAAKEIFDRRDVYAILVILFVSICSYYLGRISAIEADRKPVMIEHFELETPSNMPLKEGSGGSQNGQNTAQNLPAAALGSTTSKAQAESAQSGFKGMYVGSKNGSKYHLPTCPGAQQIATANQIWFASKAEAERAGYTPAGNCKGI